MTSQTSPLPTDYYVGEWHDEMPMNPGFYWFCGDPWFGAMGHDWTPQGKPDVQLYMVEIFRTGNGTMGTTCGKFFPRNKFDREINREGWVGKWCRASVPYSCEVKE